MPLIDPIFRKWRIEMNILWLTPTRPVPWISALAKEIMSVPEINLTILCIDSRIKKMITEKSCEGIRYIRLKIPRGRINILTLYQKKINILRRYLENNYKNYNLFHIHGTEHLHLVSSRKIIIPI